MRGRIVAAARLLTSVLAVGVLVGLGLSVGLAGQASSAQESTRAIWACRQQDFGALRPVGNRDKCRDNERAVNLNNQQNPIGVCVREREKLIRLVRFAGTGSKPSDCDRRTETFLRLPGDAPIELCLRADGYLRLCTGGAKPHLTLPARNRPPTAGDDAAATDEDTPGTVDDVLANDADPDGDPLALGQIDTAGTKGKVTNNGDGTFGYDPDGRFEALAEGETATDGFAYAVRDGQGGTASATVAVTIEGANDAPTAADDAATTDEQTAIKIAVRGNDADPDATDALTVDSLDTEGTVGKVTIEENRVAYDPNGKFRDLAPGRTRADTFAYTIADGHGGTATAKVSLKIEGVNDRPVATDDDGARFGTDENSPFTTGSALANDADPDGGTLAVTDVDATGTKGKVTPKPDGSFDYDPDGQFEELGDGENATDVFAYTLGDGQGGTATAKVTIAIAGVNDAPRAIDDDGIGFATDEASSFKTGDVLANDRDAEGEVLTVTALNDAGTRGKVSDNGDGTFGYDPDGRFEDLPAGETATDSFAYTASDGNGGSGTATVTVVIRGANDAPRAVDDDGDGFGTDEDTAFTTGNLLANDTDADAADALSLTNIDRTATKGKVADNGDGKVAYDPNGGFDSLAKGESATDTSTTPSQTGGATPTPRRSRSRSPASTTGRRRGTTPAPRASSTSSRSTSWATTATRTPPTR